MSTSKACRCMYQAVSGSSKRESRGIATSSKLLQETIEPSTTVASKSWKRALPEGQLPAYDEALKYIAADSARCKEMLNKLQNKLSATKDEVEISDLQALVEQMEVESEINTPEARWQFRRGQIDHSRAVHRQMSDLRWKKDGDLAMLMQRLKASHVLPDVLPTIEPVAEITAWLPNGKRLLEDTLIMPEDAISPSRLSCRVMHTDTRHYTLVLIDPDVPNEETERYDTYCHQLATNIPLSASQPSIDLNEAILPYQQPLPPKGSGIHRYVYVLLEQPSQLNADESDLTRENFSVRDFMAKHNLIPAGVHYFRSQWSPAISTENEVRYGKMPKIDTYKLLGAQRASNVAAKQ